MRFESGAISDRPGVALLELERAAFEQRESMERGRFRYRARQLLAADGLPQVAKRPVLHHRDRALEARVPGEDDDRYVRDHVL